MDEEELSELTPDLFGDADLIKGVFTFGDEVTEDFVGVKLLVPLPLVCAIFGSMKINVKH